MSESIKGKMAFFISLSLGYRLKVKFDVKALDGLNLKKGIWKWSAYEPSNHDICTDDWLNKAHTPDWIRSQARKNKRGKKGLIKKTMKY